MFCFAFYFNFFIFFYINFLCRIDTLHPYNCYLIGHDGPRHSVTRPGVNRAPPCFSGSSSRGRHWFRFCSIVLLDVASLTRHAKHLGQFFPGCCGCSWCCVLWFLRQHWSQTSSDSRGRCWSCCPTPVAAFVVGHVATARHCIAVAAAHTRWTIHPGRLTASLDIPSITVCRLPPCFFFFKIRHLCRIFVSKSTASVGSIACCVRLFREKMTYCIVASVHSLGMQVHWF